MMNYEAGFHYYGHALKVFIQDNAKEALLVALDILLRP